MVTGRYVHQGSTFTSKYRYMYRYKSTLCLDEAEAKPTLGLFLVWGRLKAERGACLAASMPRRVGLVACPALSHSRTDSLAVPHLDSSGKWVLEL